MLRRLGVFVDGLLELANRHRLEGELIIVEWNPPVGPRLHEVLEPQNSSECLSIRFIEVPPAVHNQIRNSDTIPLFQMIAKNVGIRRAHGDYVVATNQDILFSDALIGFLAGGDLDDRCMYRIDRYDVPGDIPVGVPIDHLLEWCEKAVIRVHRRYGSFDRRRGVLRSWPVLRWLSPIEAARGGWRAILDVARLVNGGVKHLSDLIGSARVHTNACGDFTLLSRKRWNRLRGYAEFPIFSMHLDALLCWQAVAAGAKQRILVRPYRIYHMDHPHSWVTMDWREKLNTFAEKPWLDLGLLCDVRDELRHKNNAGPINDPNWGFADLELPEVEVRGGQKSIRVPQSESLRSRYPSAASSGG
jgi:hypothetical protein